jgi:hypothetical protein
LSAELVVKNRPQVTVFGGRPGSRKSGGAFFKKSKQDLGRMMLFVVLGMHIIVLNNVVHTLCTAIGPTLCLCTLLPPWWRDAVVIASARGTDGSGSNPASFLRKKQAVLSRTKLA